MRFHLVSTRLSKELVDVQDRRIEVACGNNPTGVTSPQRIVSRLNLSCGPDLPLDSQSNYLMV